MASAPRRAATVQGFGFRVHTGGLRAEGWEVWRLGVSVTYRRDLFGARVHALAAPAHPLDLGDGEDAVPHLDLARAKVTCFE
jgi:hypothetical protein